MVAGCSAKFFSGRGTKFEAPNPGLDVTKPFTVEAYLTPGDLPIEGIPDTLVVAMINNEMGIQVRNNRWVFYSTHNEASAPTPLTPNRRIHFAGVRTRTQRKLYLDGKLVASMDEPLDIKANEKKYPLSMTGGRLPFTIDALRITNGAAYVEDFTPPERLSADKDTLALYQFDEAQGDIAHDSSGHNLHGKLTGSKWLKLRETPNTLAPPRISCSATTTFPH